MIKPYSELVVDVGFRCDPEEMSDIRAFHERSKSARSTDYRSVSRVHEYLYEGRALLEVASNQKTYFSKPVVALPEPADIQMGLSEVHRNRVSVRDFAAKQTTLEQLSTTLSGLRANRTVRPDDYVDVEELTVHLRPYPSPGALYPCEVYIANWGNTEIDLGIYHYDPIRHGLAHINDQIDPDAFLLAMGNRGKTGLNHAGFAIAITTFFERVAVKYGYMGYRFAMIETGVLSMQIANAAVGAGLRCLLWGGYYDDAMNAQLGIDGTTETITGSAWLGHAT